MFFILQYALKDSGLGSMTMTVVALSLPLSALWASTATDRQTVTLLSRGGKSPSGTQTSSLPSIRSPRSEHHFIKLAAAGGRTESKVSSEPRSSDIKDWDLEPGIKVDRSFTVDRAI